MKTLIINGGNINYDFASAYIKNNNYNMIIAVDGGLVFADKMGIKPDVVIGDFDTVPKDILDKYTKTSEIIRFNPIKDNTDSDMALNTAIDRGSTSIDILGATGKRIDHTIANIHILMMALEKRIDARIIDDRNLLYLIDDTHEIMKDKAYGRYVSIIPLTEVAKGITLTGFKYPLSDYDYKIGKSIGVSNEILDEKAVISLKEGILIVMETRD